MDSNAESAGPTEECDGRTSQMRIGSPWLAAEDLEGLGDVKVTIKRITHHRKAVFQNGKEQEVYAIEFEGAYKRMVLNTTNRKMIKEMYGPNVSEWKGKELCLYHDKNVRYMGEISGGIRVRLR